MNAPEDLERCQRDVNAFLDEYEARHASGYRDPASLARELYRLGTPLEVLEKCRQRLYRLVLKESKSHDKATAFAEDCVKAMLEYKRKNRRS